MHIADRWTKAGPPDSRNRPTRVRTDRYGKGHRWLAVWYEPGGARRKKAFDNKDAAQDYLDQVTTQRLTGTYIGRGRGAITVREAAGEWQVDHPDWAPSTRARNLDILRVHVLPAWGDTPLEAVTGETVQEWANGLSGSPSGARRIHQVLSGILTTAVKRKRIPVNPALDTKFATHSRRQPIALSVRELDAFVAAHPQEWRTWARLLGLTGPRVSEAAGLKVRDVDLKRRRYQVWDSVVVVNGRKIHQAGRAKTRTSQGRWVPLIGPLVEEVGELIEGKARGDFVFTTSRGASVNRANYSRRIFRDAATAIGRPELHPHDLRHTAVTIAIRAGASVKVVQAIAGHRTASMTLDVYAHLFDADLDVLSDQVSALMERERSEPPTSPQEPPSSL